MSTPTFQQNNLFFISDLHLGHNTLIKIGKRPFANVDEMDATILKNWNDKVPKNSNVFVAGDLSFHKPERTLELVSQLNGRLHLILGNHDRGYLKFLAESKLFHSIQSDAFIKVPDSDVVRGYQYIHLYHFPVLVWDKAHYGSWMLHGHSHGNLKIDPHAQRLDCSVECWNYTPASYPEIKQVILNLGLKFVPLDHHV